MKIEPTNEEIRDLFPEWYEGYKRGNRLSELKELKEDIRTGVYDDELGLEIVHKQTMEEKYGLGTIKDNSFTRSLREQFDRKGYLSAKQLGCLR